MAGDIGQGQTLTFGSTVLPNVRSINVQNTGQVISETVADGVLTQSIGTGWQFTVDFIAPTSGTHTLESAIKSGTTGTLAADVGQTHYAATTARSGGFTKSSPSNGFISYSLNISIDNDPTMTAVS